MKCGISALVNRTTTSPRPSPGADEAATDTVNLIGPVAIAWRNCYRVDSSRRFDADRAVRFSGGRLRAGLAVLPRPNCVGSGGWDRKNGVAGKKGNTGG